ncbi:MAG: glycosyltransferase family 2 protein [Bifidobacteriaceae bacterium]|jgi:glycosyltransferase involved in cell wall biosynthesis|nr:glycosyltransferase family 2 protein [Bifidobacteriaceae bacterium]
MDRAEFDDLWLVIPAYNEARVLGETLAAATAVFPHVCVVNDASTDQSGQIAQSFTPAGVRVVNHLFNLGQGAALQTGFDYTLSDPLMSRVVTFDADGQHLVSDAVRLARRLTEGFDMVLGSRFIEATAGLGPEPDGTLTDPAVAGGQGAPADGATKMGFAKRWLLKTAVAYTAFSVKLPLTDTHNGLRALNRRAVEAMKLTQPGMAHATEILERIKAEQLSFTEEGVEIRYSEYSRSKGQSMLNSVNILVDLMLR